MPKTDNETKHSELKFTPPKDWTPPEGEKNGEFELVCTFKVEDDGKLCLTMLGDTPMEGYDEEKGEKESDKEPKREMAPSYDGAAQGMMSMMGGQ